MEVRFRAFWLFIMKKNFLGSVWQWGELLQKLVVRNLKVKYQRSILGFLWTLIQPVIMILIIISVFTYVVRIQIEDYWAFLVSGFFVWNFIQQCINAGSYVIMEHANMIRSVALPKVLLIVSAVLSRLIEFLLELLIVLVILLLVHHKGVPVGFLAVPVLIVLQVLLALGLALLISIPAVFYHDIQHALPLVLMALFYMSPVFYPITMVPYSFQSVYLFNPIAQILDLYHIALYQGDFPSALALSRTILTSILTVMAGYFIFNRYQSVIAEIV